MEPHRSQRLAQTLRDELDEILNYELEDPRIQAITVTEVLLSSDSKRATVLVAPTEEQAPIGDALAALEHARGHVRHILLERMDLFRMPDLKFEAATGLSGSTKARRLLRRAHKGRPRDSSTKPVT